MCEKRKGNKKRQSAIQFWTSIIHICMTQAAWLPLSQSNWHLQFLLLQTIVKLYLKADASLGQKTQSAGIDLWISSLSKLTTRCYAIIRLLSYQTFLDSSPLTCIGTQNHLRHTSCCLFLARGQENWLHRSVMVIQQRSRPSLGAGHT